MKKSFVVRLEYLAFVASYKEIKSSLLLCREHRPEGKPHALVTFSCLLSRNPLISSQTVINFLKYCLDQYLRGTISNEVRKKFVQKYNQSTREYFHGDTIDVWAFLDSVLDESFHELETYVSAPESEPSGKLVITIAKRSSQLQKLKLNFNYMKRTTLGDKLEPIILNLSSLKNLTSLCLYELNSNHRSVLKFVGKSCPSLSHLSLLTHPKSESNCRTTGKDVLSLIFGELIDFLLPDKNDKPAWISDDALQQLLVPFKYRTPLCFSLRQLELGDGANMSIATAAFAIRSIPFLQKIDLSMSRAIAILHRTRKLEAKEMQTTFEKLCHEAAIRQEFIPHPLKNPPKLSRYLSLTSIRGIPVRVVEVIELVRHMCPSLEEAAFFETSFSYNDYFKEKTKATPQLIQSALKKWPKLKTVTINNMSQKFVRSILNAFGPQLQHLMFDECRELNLADLAACPVLESLLITKSCSLDVKQNGFSLKTNEYLPQLKSVESDICLSGWSRFFEGKTTLTRIVLYCCHIGTGASSHSDWSNVPNMWPLVEELKVKQCAGLTVGMLADIISRLSKLKEIAIPGRIRYKERNGQLSFDIVEKFSNRLLSMQERYESVFLEDIRHVICRVLKPKNKKATTSDYNTYSYRSHDTSDEEAYNKYYRFATTSEDDDDASDSSDGPENDACY